MATRYAMEMVEFFDNNFRYQVSLDTFAAAKESIATKQSFDGLASDGFSDLLDEIIGAIKNDQRLDSLQYGVVLRGLHA